MCRNADAGWGGRGARREGGGKKGGKIVSHCSPAIAVGSPSPIRHARKRPRPNRKGTTKDVAAPTPLARYTRSGPKRALAKDLRGGAKAAAEHKSGVRRDGAANEGGEK